MSPFDAKPDLKQYFYEEFFMPTQQQMPTAPLEAILDVAKEKAPFQVPISRATLERFRAKRC